MTITSPAAVNIHFTPNVHGAVAATDPPAAAITAASWRDVLPVYSACAIFEPLPPDELKALGADIRQHGLYEPITVRREGGGFTLLDGACRLDVMEGAGFPLVRDGKLDTTLGHAALGLELGIAAIVELDANINPYDFVVSRNVHRRHQNLTVETNAKVLKADPNRSDRQIGALRTRKDPALLDAGPAVGRLGGARRRHAGELHGSRAGQIPAATLPASGAGLRTRSGK